MNTKVTAQRDEHPPETACKDPEGTYEAFLFSLLHGLNNPLTVLLNTSRALDSLLSLERVAKDQLKNHIEEIIESSEEIENLARNVLVSSQTFDHRGQVHHEQIRVSDVFGSLRLTHGAKAARKRQRLDFIGSAPESILLSDRFFLSTILGNLLDNAIKYSGFDTGIEVEWRVSDSSLGSIMVSDHGPGIDEKDGEKLFMRYSRLPSRPTGGESSQGLGLYVSRMLAELNGGSLKLLPSREGTCIELTLPWCLLDKSKTPIFESS